MIAHNKTRYRIAAVLPCSFVYLPLRTQAGRHKRYLNRTGMPDVAVVDTRYNAVCDIDRPVARGIPVSRICKLDRIRSHD